MDREFAREHLAQINSATKYPEIPTYHKMGGQGCLLDEVQVDFPADQLLYVTEMIDGTNARIVFLDDVFLIGSRDELLYCSDDVVVNKSLGIVDAILGAAGKLHTHVDDWPRRTVVFGEVYGGTVGKAGKRYSPTGKTSFRVFDAAPLEVDLLAFMEPAQISAWRKSVGQQFFTWAGLDAFCESYDFHMAPLIKKIYTSGLPESHHGAHAALDTWVRWSDAAIDTGFECAGEGVVIRTHSRSHIAQLRFEDYERTLRCNPKQEI